MTLRFKITLFLIVLSLLGVLGSGLLILQQATIDKKNYVNELAAAISPQISNSIDQKLQNLIFNFQEFNDALENSAKTRQSLSEEKLKSKFEGVDILFINSTSGKLIVLQLNKELTVDILALSEVVKQSQRQIKNLNANEPIIYLGQNLYAIKNANNIINAVLLNQSFYNSSFELSRGKASYLINRSGEYLFQNQLATPSINLKTLMQENSRNGSSLFSIELNTSNNANFVANFSKLKLIKDAFVLITSPQVTLLDLAMPIFKSSIYLIVILILFSILIAFWISRSLAQPIEQMAEETTRIGRGEWSSFTSVSAGGEIATLAAAFNKMIDNLKRREAELKTANNKVVQSESLAAVGRIGAGIAHEVKNPLSSVLGYCQLLDINLKNLPTADLPSPVQDKIQKYQKYTSLIIEDTKRANKIITDMLTFSRQKELQTIRVNVLDFFANIEPKFKALCDLNKVNYTSDISKIQSDTFLQIDMEQFYQVLFNLTQNAIHALASSNKSIKNINFQLLTENSEFLLLVKDNGTGINNEDITKIFEPFYSTKKVGEGSGLGLAICYGIITKHNGHISVNSVAGESTTFLIRLPLA